VLEPISPSLFADAFPNAFAQVTGVGRKIQTLCFGAQFDALNGTCHGDGALIYLKKRWLYGYKISVFPVVSGSEENTSCFATGLTFLAVSRL
jgi:hypothetical protein